MLYAAKREETLFTLMLKSLHDFIYDTYESVHMYLNIQIYRASLCLRAVSKDECFIRVQVPGKMK